MTFAANGKQPLDIWRLLSLLRALKSVFLPRKTRIDRLSQKTYFFFSLAVKLPWMDIFEKK